MTRLLQSGTCAILDKKVLLDGQAGEEREGWVKRLRLRGSKVVKDDGKHEYLIGVGRADITGYDNSFFPGFDTASLDRKEAF